MALNVGVSVVTLVLSAGEVFVGVKTFVVKLAPVDQDDQTLSEYATRQ